MSELSAPVWETSKENVLPVKRGRTVQGLKDITLKSDEDQQRLDKEEAKFKQLLGSNNNESERLDVYINYAKWARDNFPNIASKEKDVLEKFTKDFTGKTDYYNDPRLVKLWIEYADKVRDPAETFSFLYTNKVGERSALFWIAWAWVAEKDGNMKAADQIFQKGIRRVAEPKDVLQKRYHQFQRRMARQFINSSQQGELSSAPYNTESTQSTVNPSNSRQRQALCCKFENVQAHDENGVAQSNNSNRTRSDNNGEAAQINPTDKAKQAKIFQVFDENGHVAGKAEGKSAKPTWKGLGSEVERIKENSGPVLPWSAVQISSQPPAPAPSLTIPIFDEFSSHANNSVKEDVKNLPDIDRKAFIKPQVYDENKESVKVSKVASQNNPASAISFTIFSDTQDNSKPNRSAESSANTIPSNSDSAKWLNQIDALLSDQIVTDDDNEEEGTINTKLARKDISMMFQSPSVSKPGNKAVGHISFKEPTRIVEEVSIFKDLSCIKESRESINGLLHNEPDASYLHLDSDRAEKEASRSLFEVLCSQGQCAASYAGVGIPSRRALLGSYFNHPLQRNNFSPSRLDRRRVIEQLLWDEELLRKDMSCSPLSSLAPSIVSPPLSPTASSFMPPTYESVETTTSSMYVSIERNGSDNIHDISATSMKMADEQVRREREETYSASSIVTSNMIVEQLGGATGLDPISTSALPPSYVLINELDLQSFIERNTRKLLDLMHLLSADDNNYHTPAISITLINAKLPHVLTYHSKYPPRAPLLTLPLDHSNTSNGLRSSKLHSASFHIVNTEGRGTFGHTIVLREDESDLRCALKVGTEQSYLHWEAFIYTILLKRLFQVANQRRPSLLQYFHSHILFPTHLLCYNEASCLLMPYAELGTLYSAVLVLVKEQWSVKEHEVLCMLFTLQMLRSLEVLHGAGIAHCDIKTDNWVLRWQPNPGATLIYLEVCLIDLGKARLTHCSLPNNTIQYADQEERLYSIHRHAIVEPFSDEPGGTYPVNRAIEVLIEYEGNVFPKGSTLGKHTQVNAWSVEVDYLGIADCLHQLLFKSKLTIKEDNANMKKTFVPGLGLKRYWKKEMWTQVFHCLMNYKSTLDFFTLQSLLVTHIKEDEEIAKQVQVKFYGLIRSQSQPKKRA